MKTQILTDTGLKVYDQEMKNFIDKKLEDKVDAEVGKGLSTNDYNDEEKNTVAQNKEDIEEIKRQMESYETENEDIVTTTESTLENSYEGGLVINEMYGKTEQNAYTGKNLFSMRKSNTASNGISVTVDNENQSFSATGTATSSTSISIIDNYDEIKEKLKNGGTFTMSLVNATFDSAKCNISIAYGYNGTTYWIKANSEPITVPSGSSLYSVGLYVPSGTIVNLTDVKIQLEENSVATEWEPYVGGKPSPSPSYQQEIERVVLNTIKTRSKNFFHFPNVYYNGTGLTLAKNTDGTYSLNGNVTGNEIRFLGSYANTDKVITLKNGNYKCVATINDKVINSDVTLTNGTTVKGYSGNNFAITDEWAISSLKVTVPSDVSSYSNAILKIMICDYNASDNFEPYQSSEITLSEPIELNGFNGVCDVLNSESVTRRFTEVVFDGSEYWQRVTTNTTNVYRFATPHIRSSVLPYTSRMLCSHYKNVGAGNTWNKIEGCSIDADGLFIIYDEKFISATVDDFKEHLAENPITVVYELATPTTEALPIVDQIALHSIRTFNDTTYIETDSEVQPIFDVDYGCSQVGATALESHNNIEINRIIASSSHGNSITYELSKENNKIVLTGSDGSKTSVNDDNTVYTHPTYTARTGVPTANQTPSFGGTFSVTQPVSDATGHITAMNSRTVTIPNATATTSSAGLMSSSDKTKLDSLTKIELDTTLTKSGKAADAKTVGDNKVDYSDIVNNLSTAVAVTDTQTPVGCGTVKEINQKMLQIVSFDPSTGTLTTKSYDYTG